MKTFGLGFLICIGSFAADAQLALGVRGGLNLAKESLSSTDYTTSSQTGFYFAVFGRYTFSGGPWSVQVDVGYSEEGTKEASTDGDPADKGYIHADYLNVPALLRYAFPFGLFLETGPQAGFLLSSMETFGTETDDIKSYYHSVDPEWVFGGGYQLPGKLKGLSIDLRYYLSMSAINKDQVAGGSLHADVFSIGLQYAFPVAGHAK